MNLNIKNKLTIGFAVLVAILIGVGIFSITRVDLLGGLTVKLYEHPLTVIRASLEADVNIIKIHRSMKDVALAKDAAAIEKASNKINEYEKKVFNEYAVIVDRILGKEGDALIAETIEIFKAWKPIRDEVIQHMKDGNQAAATDVTKLNGTKHVVLLDSKMNALVDYAATKGAGFFKKAQQTTNSTEMFTIILVIISAIVATVLAMMLIRAITGPIGKLQNTIEIIERDSDLTHRLNMTSNDEIGTAAQAFDKMLEKFQSIVGQVNGSATQMSAAAEELSVITQETAREIQEQTSQTDQVATAINEMSATVQEVSRNAGEAAVAANETTQQANNGRQVVNESIDSMDKLASEIEQAGEVIHKLEEDGVKIGAVLDVIRGIAEQTNLLALNAAIEAARAGEQGRGFAVVADEVRTLASRTQESTQEIQQMIERLQSGTKAAVTAMDSSRAQAQNGVEKISTAGDALTTIVSGIEHINDMNTQIASAAEEQSFVAEEVNKNVVKISQIAGTSEANSAQTQNASEELSRLAVNLQGLVSQFKS